MQWENFCLFCETEPFKQITCVQPFPYDFLLEDGGAAVHRLSSRTSLKYLIFTRQSNGEERRFVPRDAV